MNFITIDLEPIADVNAFKLEMDEMGFTNIFAGCCLLPGQYMKNGIPESLLNEVKVIADKYSSGSIRAIVIPISTMFGINAIGLDPPN